MRWRVIIIILLLLILALLGAFAHFWLGWWQPSHPVITETYGDYTDESQPATLEEVLASAHQALEEIDRKVQDYSAVLVKRERIGDTLVEKKMRIKVREKPFSVYLYFVDASNEDIKGREVTYVAGRNDNKLIVHTPGLLYRFLGTRNLPPDGFLAMKGERYPITEIGLANLCRQLIKRGESAGDPSQVQVTRYPHAHIQTRTCTMLEVIYPVQEKDYRGYLARIFVDNEWQFPICVKVSGLPRDAKQEPQPVEEYTYLDLKLNNGYTDADFDPKNPQYKFP